MSEFNNDSGIFEEEELETKEKSISVLNWMGTLLLAAIPGVNILFLLGSAIFARTKSKKHFAAAALLWILIVLVLICAAWFVFGEEILTWAEKTLETAASAQ